MNAAIGFVIILLLGFVSSRLALFRTGMSLGLQSIVLAGTEFIFIGLILGPHFSHVITKEALQQLTPILSLGLGWIGLLIGLQFNYRIIRRIPSSIWKTGALISLITFVVVFVCIYILRDSILQRFPPTDNINESIFSPVVRITFCVLISFVATESTYSVLALIKRKTDARGDTIKTLELLSDIRTPMTIIGMGFWYSVCHFSNLGKWLKHLHPGNTSDVFFSSSNLSVHEQTLSGFILHLPMLSGMLWLVVTILLGVVLGWMLHYLTSERLENREMLLLLSGSVIFSAGLGAYLHLSPLFVNFIMGATLANLPNFSLGRVSNTLMRMEKPFFVVFMIIVGALWPAISPAVIIFTALLFVSRLVGLYAGTNIAMAFFLKNDQTLKRRLGLAMLPQGGVAIALVIDFKLIYPGPYSDLALGIVILSVILNQIVGPVLLTKILRISGNIDKQPTSTRSTVMTKADKETS